MCAFLLHRWRITSRRRSIHTISASPAWKNTKTSLWKNFDLKIIRSEEKGHRQELVHSQDFSDRRLPHKQLHCLVKLNKRLFLEHKPLVIAYFSSLEHPTNYVHFPGTGGLFGASQQQQTQSSAFGTKTLGFGQTPTSTQSAFGGFGQPQPQQQTSIFSQQQQQQPKPFGTSIFGTTTTSQPAPFGTPAPTTGFGGFGGQQQVLSLFRKLYIQLCLYSFVIDSKPF